MKLNQVIIISKHEDEGPVTVKAKHMSIYRHFRADRINTRGPYLKAVLNRDPIDVIEELQLLGFKLIRRIIKSTSVEQEIINQLNSRVRRSSLDYHEQRWILEY